MFAKVKSDVAKSEEEEEKQKDGEKQSLDEAFRRVEEALGAVERNSGRKVEMVTREIRKPKLRGRRKSVAEDPSVQPSESDLSMLFGVGFTSEVGSSRLNGYNQGETAGSVSLLSNITDLTMTDSDSETFPEVGGISLSMFLDELNPLSKEIHPALPSVLEEKQADNAMRGGLIRHFFCCLKLLTAPTALDLKASSPSVAGELIRLKEELYILHTNTRQTLLRQERLVGQARTLATRATMYREEVRERSFQYHLTAWFISRYKVSRER